MGLYKTEPIFYINNVDFILKSRNYECTNGAQTLVVWAFLDAYSLVKVAAWQSSNIGCFFVAYF